MLLSEVLKGCIEGTQGSRLHEGHCACADGDGRVADGCHVETVGESGVVDGADARHKGRERGSVDGGDVKSERGGG